MIKLLNIKGNVRRGDYDLIHEMTSIPIDTIKAVMCGRRNSETDHGQEILKAAQQIIANRNKLLTQVNNSKPVARKTKKVPNQTEIFPTNEKLV